MIILYQTKRNKTMKEMLSKYQLKIIEDNNFYLDKNEKFVSNLGNRNIENLKLFLELGLKFKKIHRVLELKKLPLLKPYIEHNIELRNCADK